VNTVELLKYWMPDDELIVTFVGHPSEQKNQVRASACETVNFNLQK
jgi:hypothetical protein